MISFFILLAPSNTLVSLLYPRACIHLYRLLNQSVPEQQWALFYIGSQCPIKERNDHVCRSHWISAYMIIQQKFLCLAANEGFVLKISTVNIEQHLVFFVCIWVLTCGSFIKPSIYPIFDFLPYFLAFCFFYHLELLISNNLRQD